MANFVQHLIHHNIQLGAGDHYVSEAIYLYDPDGNGIEVYRDRPEEDWVWISEDDIHMGTDPVDFASLLSESDNIWNKLPKETVIGHIHLSVSNLQQSEQFYIHLLGYHLVKRYTRQASFVSTGNYHHHIGLNTWESLGGTIGSDHHVGIKSFTIVLNNEEVAKQINDKLKDANYKAEIFPEAPSYGGSQLFSTVDPSGIRIIFTTEEL